MRYTKRKEKYTPQRYSTIRTRLKYDTYVRPI